MTKPNEDVKLVNPSDASLFVEAGNHIIPIANINHIQILGSSLVVVWFKRTRGGSLEPISNIDFINLYDDEARMLLRTLNNHGLILKEKDEKKT